ncbi:MAG: 50S ribosomal protein L2 [Candidatus Roizmanbacteria bacterium]|nr:50S ribosomal protein L2 [Candidatus Roizmanbacteria bacterium]
MVQLNSSQKPEKKLTTILKKHSGRDASGKISVRHQGKRQKRLYRKVDFLRDKKDIEAKVLRIEYDPNRNAHIALVEYTDGERRYILHPTKLEIGSNIIAAEKAEIVVGNALPLGNIPVGIEVHNIELYAGQGGIMVRGAGTFASVVAKDGHYVHLKLSSGEVRKFHKKCWATIGRVGNIEHKDEVIGSAGRKRLMGIRPTVRGTAQNPRSHPHGGGEGRSGEGMNPKTPWGKSARGTRTRSKKKWSNSLILARRKK